MYEKTSEIDDYKRHSIRMTLYKQCLIIVVFLHTVASALLYMYEYCTFNITCAIVG